MTQAQGSALDDAGAGLCGGACWRRALQGTWRRTSQANLEARVRLSLQDAMRQPPVPSLFVDQRVVVRPAYPYVRHRNRFPPSRGSLRARNNMQ